MPQTQDMAPYPRHSIQTQGRHDVVLSIDMERHTGIHNYPFNLLGLTQPRNPSLTFYTHTHTANAQLYDTAVVESIVPSKLVCLCFTFHRQRGHLETAPPFTVTCEGREAR